MLLAEGLGAGWSGTIGEVFAVVGDLDLTWNLLYRSMVADPDESSVRKA